MRQTIRFVGGLSLAPMPFMHDKKLYNRKRKVHCTIAFRNLALITIHREKNVPLLYDPITNVLQDVERIVLYPPEDAIVTDAVLIFAKKELLEVECAFVVPIYDQRVGIKSFGLFVKWEPKE